MTKEIKEKIEYLFFNTKENQDGNIARQLGIPVNKVCYHIDEILLAKKNIMDQKTETEQPLIYESKMNYEAVYKIKY